MCNAHCSSCLYMLPWDTKQFHCSGFERRGSSSHFLSVAAPTAAAPCSDHGIHHLNLLQMILLESWSCHGSRTSSKVPICEPRGWYWVLHSLSEAYGETSILWEASWRTVNPSLVIQSLRWWLHLWQCQTFHNCQLTSECLSLLWKEFVTHIPA